MIFGCNDSSPPTARAGAPTPTVVSSTEDTLWFDWANGKDLDDSSSPPGPFDDVTDLRIMSDSIIVVPDESENLVRLFRVTGEWIRNLGRPGAGPGEFKSISAAFVGVRKEIVVYDFLHRRSVRFDVEGKLLGTDDLSAFPGVSFIGRVGDSYVGYRNFVARTDPADSIDVVLAVPGRKIKLLHRLPPRERFTVRFRNRGGTSFLSMGRIFGPEPIIASDSNTIAVADQFSGLVYVYGSDGQSLGSLQSGILPVQVTEDDAKVERERILSGFPDAGPELRRFVADLAPVDFYPYFASIAVNDDGIWVLPYRSRDAQPRCWTHLGAPGTSVGRVMCEPGFVRAFTNRVAVGLRHDADGVVSVTVFQNHSGQNLRRERP